MRNIITTAAALMGAILISSAAQASTSSVLHTNVPFAFVVNGLSMPAGGYTIEREDGDPMLLMLRSDKEGHAVVFTTIPESGRDPAGSKPVLSFTRTGGGYRLTGIWENNDRGWDVSQR
jgi:hypothetical protein